MENKYKVAAQRQWNEHPCGAPSSEPPSDEDLELKAYFDKISESRYQSNSWLNSALPWEDVFGQKVLEIGHGIGTDLVRMSKNGAIVSGIDLTERHHQMAMKNLKLHGNNAELVLGDAATLPFEDDCFDLSYSIGVLHHTPDFDVCLNEIHRTLKPGGKVVISVYHRWSFFHLLHKCFVEGVLRGKLLRLGYKGLMATVEQGCDGITNKPLVNTYGASELSVLFSIFKEVKFKVSHLDPSHTALPFLGATLSMASCKKYASRFGWYITAYAEK